MNLEEDGYYDGGDLVKVIVSVRGFGFERGVLPE